MSEVVKPIEVEPKIHEPSIVKQIVENRKHPLDVVREAISNMAPPEVKASKIEIKFYMHPEYGATFIFRDDGCGMGYSEDENNPKRLNKFINLGFAGVAGFEADKFGWKGLGSKLMLNGKKLELTTWTGSPDSFVYKVEINDPRAKILNDIPEMPKVLIFSRKPDVSDKKGTEITLYGYDGGETKYSKQELEQYLYQRTLIGYTKEDNTLPQAYLNVDGKEEKLGIGYKFVKKQYNEDGTPSWRTVAVDPPIKVEKTTKRGKKVKVELKGGFTLDTGKFHLSPFRDNVGLRLSVLGIPYFELDYNRLKGKKFIIYKSLANFIVECDALKDKLNIDRSGYPQDDDVVKAFEDATRECFNKFADSEEYKRFLEKRQKEDEQQKSKFLSERKEALSSPDQEFVFYHDKNEDLFLHRVPQNEHDTLALFWKLEGMGKVPFYKFKTLEHTNQRGIDVIANFQETEDSEYKYMVAIEFESHFENFKKHEHNPKQTSMIICWEVKNPRAIEKVSEYKYNANFDGDIINVLEIKRFPSITVKNNVSAI